MPLEKGFSSSLAQQVCVWFVQIQINPQHISDLGGLQTPLTSHSSGRLYDYKVLGSSSRSKFSCFLTQPCAYHGPAGKPEFPLEGLLQGTFSIRTADLQNTPFAWWVRVKHQLNIERTITTGNMGCISTFILMVIKILGQFYGQAPAETLLV